MANAPGAEFYFDRLTQNTLPFWLDHGIDEEHGGYLLGLERDGSVLSTDKGAWTHGRWAWVLSRCHESVDPRPEWLEVARSGIDFLRRHAFDADGRMFFSMTREGRPLRKRRYLFSECFMVLALAAYGRAADDAQAREEAQALFGRILGWLREPGALEPKVDPRVRPQRGLAMPMILLHVAQELRRCTSDPRATPCIDRCIDEIERYHLRDDFRCLLETVGPNGEFRDTFEGRTINPGHSIEAAWFLLEEARHRGNDDRLRGLGLRILEDAWAWGWDPEYGGLFYLRDCKGASPSEPHHDMKYWWPHNEAILGCLLAKLLTGETLWSDRLTQVHRWAYGHFPDELHGEWFGYLHRDGTPSSEVKGNFWKGPYHLPRQELLAGLWLRETRSAAGDQP